MERVNIQQVQSDKLERFFSWAHWGASPDELAVIKREYIERRSLVGELQPLVASIEGNWVAGAYFTCLPGSLAMLGAVRAIDGFLALGSSLLQSLAHRLRNELSIVQIQAAVQEADQAARFMLTLAGFHSLTAVDQMWLNLLSTAQHLTQEDSPLPESSLEPSRDTDPSNGNDDLAADSDSQQPLSRQGLSRQGLSRQGLSRHRLSWSPARSMKKETFIDLLMATFEETMDCPELNGLRSGPEVLASFLMGGNWDSVNLWEVVWCGKEPVGCLMLAQHPNGVIEVAYMGLIRSARSQGLGRRLIERAKQVTRQLGSATLVLAVDCRNTPALKTYAHSGFQFHQRLQVYYLPLATRLSNDHLMQ